MSHDFLDFRAKASLHHTTSPPHDHDLNPIAERVIGLISETACAVRAAGGAAGGGGAGPRAAVAARAAALQGRTGI